MAQVLVIGGGGREQAIAQAMELSDEVSRVEVHKNVSSGLEAFSGTEKPFVIIGPEAPSVEGVADDLREDGYVVFGVNQAAAQWESSKSKTVKLMRYAGVTHPATFIAEGEWMPTAARAYVAGMDPKDYVIKADGLCGGKGSVLADTKQKAKNVVEDMIRGGYEGAGSQIINFAKRKKGPEASAVAVVGKNDFVVLPLAQDHKRLYDGDEGPNTGGTGAYAPVPKFIFSDYSVDQVNDTIGTLLDAMRDEGSPIEQGVIYLGLMKSVDLVDDNDEDSDVLEINVRFGDPETQVQFALLNYLGVDSYRLLRSAAEGNLEKPDINPAKLSCAALTVAIMADGYCLDRDLRVGDEIFGLDQAYPNVTIQQAGMTRKNGKFVTSGGRVLYVTAVGENIDEAATAAYAAIGEQAIHFAGYHYRRDIGWQARALA